MKYIIGLTISVLITNQIVSGAFSTTKRDVIRSIKMASAQTGVPVRILLGLCKTESALKTRAKNENDAGSPSYGLCQIKLSTAQDMGFTGKIKSLYNPYINTLLAARYLIKKYRKHDHNWVKALSAYNSGHYRHVNVKYVDKVFKYAIDIDDEDLE